MTRTHDLFVKYKSLGAPLLLLDLIFVTIFAFFFCIYNLWDQGINRNEDEMIHIKVMQEMLHSGDLLHPTIGGQPYFSKPPLKMWLAMIPLKLFGESNLTYRLINGLAGIGIFIVTYLFALRLHASRLAACISVLTLAGARHLITGPHGVRNATQDPLMILISLLALYCSWIIASSENPAKKYLKLFFGLLIGASVLTKSVAGLVPVLITGVFFLSAKVLRKELFSDYKYWLSGFVLGFLPLVLFVGHHLNKNYELFTTTLHNETIKRALVGYHNRNDYLYYFKELFTKSTIANPLIIFSAFFGNLFFLKDLKYRFLLIWILIPLIGYTAVNSKLPWYILITYPAFALSIGGLIASCNNSQKRISLSVVLFLVLGFRAYKILSVVNLDKRFNIDKALSEVAKRKDSRILAYKDPLRFGTGEPNLRLQIEKVYLEMLHPYYSNIVEPNFKNFFCLAADCPEIKKALGEPTEVIALEPYLTRRENGYFLFY